MMTKYMSDIFGKGWDDDHNWQRGSTAQVGSTWAAKSTTYQCRNCGVAFSHPYDIIPDIFQAIEQAGVKEHCPTPNIDRKDV